MPIPVWLVIYRLYIQNFANAARAPIPRGEHPELHVLSDRLATAEYMHA